MFASGKSPLEALDWNKEVNSLGDYQSLLSDLVKKQMVMLGPNVAITIARRVSALTIAADGQVTAISGDPQNALSQLVQEYMNLSGQIAQTTLQSLLEKYPEIKGA